MRSGSFFVGFSSGGSGAGVAEGVAEGVADGLAAVLAAGLTAATEEDGAGDDAVVLAGDAVWSEPAELAAPHPAARAAAVRTTSRAARTKVTFAARVHPLVR
jgi:hypothetical protein